MANLLISSWLCFTLSLYISLRMYLVMFSKVSDSLIFKLHLDFKNEQDLSDHSKVVNELDTYLLYFLQTTLKAPNVDPIIIARDSLI